MTDLADRLRMVAEGSILEKLLKKAAARIEALEAGLNDALANRYALAQQAAAELVGGAQDEIERLKAENARLAAWQCIHLDGVTGITSNEHGHQSCAKDVEITRLKAERDARPDAAQVQQMSGAFRAVNINRAFEAYGVELESLKEAQTRAAVAEAGNARLKATLQEFAKQKRTDELGAAEIEHADFEGAYDEFIDKSRKALEAKDAAR